MKRFLLVFLTFSLVLFLFGCSDFQVRGIENFNETDCCFGLNDDLLPDNREFLTNYPYDEGSHYYCRNSWGPIKAKTFVILRYSPEDYRDAKDTCLDYFRFSETHRYACGTFTFQQIEESWERGYPHWFRMLGTDDKNHCLIFIDYINEDNEDTDKYLAITDFPRFFLDNFGEYMEELS